MQKRSSKQTSRDINEIAARIVSEAVGDSPERIVPEEKNPAAVALGRLGGKVGGKARAAKLTLLPDPRFVRRLGIGRLSGRVVFAIPMAKAPNAILACHPSASLVEYARLEELYWGAFADDAGALFVCRLLILAPVEDQCFQFGVQALAGRTRNAC
jgi:hypothetical protein